MEFCDPDWACKDRWKKEWDILFYHRNAEEEYEDGSKEIGQCVKHKREGYTPNECEECPPGFYCSGNYIQNPCPIGTFNPNFRARYLSDCIPCIAGTYGSSEGASSCTPCQTGYIGS